MLWEGQILERQLNVQKNFPPNINELDELNIESLSSKIVKPPRVKNAIGWIEAKLDREITGENYSLIIGKVLCAEINENYLKDGKLIQEPLVLLMAEFRQIGEKVADHKEFADDLKSIKF